jgi:hypothetical protein
MPILRRTFVIFVPVILHPFQDIAVHVVKPEAVGLFFANRIELIFGILFIPTGPIQILFLITRIATCAGTGPAGKLPFRLGRQPQPGPCGIALRILQAYPHHRLSRLIELTVGPIFRFRLIRILTQKSAILLIGNWIRRLYRDIGHSAW